MKTKLSFYEIARWAVVLIALVGEILGITGIVLARKHRFTHNTKAALVCSIIGLVLSVLNQVLGILLLFA